MNRRRAFYSTLVLLVVFLLIAAIPQQIFAQTKKGIELYNSGEYREAERVFREALKADSKDTAANYYLGLSLLEQKNYSGALDIFLNVKKSQDRADQSVRPPVPSEYQILLALGRARLGLKQYAEAVKDLEKAISLDKYGAYAYYYVGLAYYAMGNGKRAAEDLDTFIKMAPNAPEVEHAKEIRNLC